MIDRYGQWIPEDWPGKAHDAASSASCGTPTACRRPNFRFCPLGGDASADSASVRLFPRGEGRRPVVVRRPARASVLLHRNGSGRLPAGQLRDQRHRPRISLRRAAAGRTGVAESPARSSPTTSPISWSGSARDGRRSGRTIRSRGSGAGASTPSRTGRTTTWRRPPACLTSCRYRDGRRRRRFLSRGTSPTCSRKEFEENVDAAARRQVPALKGDPNLIGWFIGNEPQWARSFGSLVPWADMLLADPEPSATKRNSEELLAADPAGAQQIKDDFRLHVRPPLLRGDHRGDPAPRSQPPGARHSFRREPERPLGGDEPAVRRVQRQHLLPRVQADAANIRRFGEISGRRS